MSSTADRAREANLAAEFYSMSPDPAAMERPGIQVAGVMVIAYVNDGGEFIVSVHCDTADVETFPEWSEVVPVRVHGVSA